MLEATVDLLPEATLLLDQVLAGDLFVAADFPSPTDAERRGPVTTTSSGDLPLLDTAGIVLEGTDGEGLDDDV